MASTAGVMSQIIREGMDEYWRAVYAPSDDGLSPIEIQWRCGHERDVKRMEEKFEHKWNAFFKNMGPS